MDNPADNLDQAYEDILTPTVSDDALEAAASMERSSVWITGTFDEPTIDRCCW